MEQDVPSSSSCAALCIIHGLGGAKRDNVSVFFFFNLSKIKCREGGRPVSEGPAFLSEEVEWRHD